VRLRSNVQGRPLIGSSVRDIVWLRPDGSEMDAHSWQQDHARALAVFLSGDGLNDVDKRGRPMRDDSFVLMFNADASDGTFSLPASLQLGAGEKLVDTRSASTEFGIGFDPNHPYVLQGRSLALVRFSRAVHP
jgi:glycogen operon protein